MTDIDHQSERIVAGQLLTATAAAGSAVVDSFLTWSLAGAAAVLALVVANLDSLSAFIEVGAVKSALFVWLVGAAATAAAKGLAAITQAAEAGRICASKLVSETPDIESLDASWMLNHVASSMIWPWRGIVERSFEDVEKGDFSATGRRCMRISQWQTNFAAVAFLLVVTSLAILSDGIRS